MTRVYLEDVLAQAPSTPGLELLHLLLAEPHAALEQAHGLLKGEQADDRAWVAWVETILVYKLSRLTREEIRGMLHLFDVDLKEATFFYQEVFAEGRKDEGSTLVLRLLKRRFGELDPGGSASSRWRTGGVGQSAAGLSQRTGDDGLAVPAAVPSVVRAMSASAG